MEYGRPRVAVSSCLLGEAVRHNGGHSRNRFLTDVLAGYVDWVPCCPEILIGLGAPRETLHLERAPGGPRLVSRRTRRDLTSAMRTVADDRAARLDADGYVFKAKSPSCGIHGIPLYDGGTLVDRRNRGLFAGTVIDAHPLLPIEDEGRLTDPVLREAFVERIFAHARLRRLLESDWRPRDLVAFHARHKMQILAHAPERYYELGRLVASVGTRPRAEVAAEYAAAFRAALADRASTGRNVNVLQHCLGMVSERLDPARRADLVDVVRAYREREVPLSVPVSLLHHHARGEAAGYLGEQTYLSPYPRELGLRNHVPC
ncbi:hypothetical protein Misp01_58820 [Microtetraspora sp. NBRC 13810]|uniref:YbgA family protein n=1 Tax=Microtetraspora sp. NBRC 13810 TaxID=3030990 RepID=UPI0024A32C0E|nr:DUF523 and DUF1722 domain-containing protein [Microtetraspora sp. NBRC 13810]GLW10754.1 hypothetical protein Misp01_58820 [Microtetraspora sp. NBRC 13810]